MTVSLLQKSVRILPIIFILGIVGAGIYGFQGDAGKQESPIAQTSPAGGFSKALATGPLAAFLVHNERKTIAPFSFTDATGATRSLDQWKGRVVLLNLWATWCTPCRKEMSDLAQLQKAMGGDAFEVVALSIDRKGLIASQAFLKEIAADSLKAYVEPDGKSLTALQALGLPATVLIDRNGKEAGRILGPAVWSSPEAKALIQALLDEKL